MGRVKTLLEEEPRAAAAEPGPGDMPPRRQKQFGELPIESQMAVLHRTTVALLGAVEQLVDCIEWQLTVPERVTPTAIGHRLATLEAPAREARAILGLPARDARAGDEFDEDGSAEHEQE